MNYEKLLVKTMVEFISRTYKHISGNKQTIIDHPDLDIIDKAQIQLHIAYLEKAIILLDDICKEITGNSIIELANKITEKKKL